MSMDDRIREAYADPDVDDDILDTIELDHVSFETPIRIIANNDTDMTLPLGEGKGSAPFQACGVGITLNGFDDDGPTSGNVTIENVSKLLQPYLKQAVRAGFPLHVTYRGYTVRDLSQPGEIRGGMLLTRVSLGPTVAQGTLENATKLDRQAFPRLTYSLAKYRALHGY